MFKYGGIYRIVSRTSYAGYTKYIVQGIADGWPWKDVSEHDDLEDAKHAATRNFNWYQNSNFTADVVVDE